ncbi:MAG: hypothetical protein O3B21_09860 [Proteobacteria bacterium]|nr:hypothetical protein [Pseudomonadota bacterium]MDA1356910.1 hypothetical protein [Pseudomonadota bacterium]
MGNKKNHAEQGIDAVEAPADERFRETSPAERRELRDIALAPYAAFEKRILEDILGKVQAGHQIVGRTAP